MSTEPDTIVLAHLRHIQASLDRMEQRLDDGTTRLGVRSRNCTWAKPNFTWPWPNSRLASTQ